MPALERAIGVEAVRRHAPWRSSARSRPSEMAASLAFMLPAMNVDDRTEMLGGMRAWRPARGVRRRRRPRPVRARPDRLPGPRRPLGVRLTQGPGPGWGRDGGTGARHRRLDAARVLGRRRAGPAPAARRRGRRSTASCPTASGSRSTASSARCGPATRAPGSTPTCSSSPTAILPAEVVEAAQVQVTRVVPETFVPPLPGTPVRRAAGAERDEALDLTGVERRLPAGLTRDGEPVVPRPRLHRRDQGRPRQHLAASPAWPRRRATPRSCSTRCSPPACSAPTATNTTAPDLQRQGRGPAVPRPRQHPARRGPAGPVRAARADGRRRSARCGCWPRLGGATPTARRRPAPARPACARCTGRSPSSAPQGLLPFLFADAEDERQQYTIVVQSVAAQLRQAAIGTEPATARCASTARTVRTFAELVDADRVQADPRRSRRGPADQRWTGRAVGRGTINAFVRRLASAERHVEHLIRADIADAAQPRDRPRRPPGDRRRPAPAARPGQAVRRRRRAAPGVRRQGGVGHGRGRCSSSCSTSSTSTRRATPPARSRRSSSTSPSAAAASA